MDARRSLARLFERASSVRGSVTVACIHGVCVRYSPDAKWNSASFVVDFATSTADDPSR